jgi:thiamine-phosphate pyrophosphorylase
LKLPDPPLLAITDRHQAHRPLIETAEAIFAGGCRWLSLREKDLPPDERLALLRELVLLGRRFGATVGIHEDLATALSARADALHLPENGVVANARAPMGEALIGISAHDAAGIERAAAAGADYATLSPIFMSASKPEYGPPLGLAALRDSTRAARLPIVALGGIDERRIDPCIEAGAAGVAVMGELMRARDPERSTARLLAALRPALAAH